MYFMPINEMMIVNKEQFKDLKKKVDEGCGLRENMKRLDSASYYKDTIFYIIKKSKNVGDYDNLDILIEDKLEGRFYVNKHFFNYAHNMRVP